MTKDRLELGKGHWLVFVAIIDIRSGGRGQNLVDYEVKLWSLK